LCQFQADLLGVPIERPVHAETTAIGAAALAGLAVGLWPDPASFAATRAVDRRFEPAMSADRRARLLHGWHRAVERSLSWAEPDA
jgi:glycerol kinase